MELKKIGIISVFIVVLTTCAFAGNEDPVLAEIGDIQIHQSDIDFKINEIPPYAQANFKTIDGQKKLLDRLIRTKLLMKAAIADGYLENEDVKHKIEEATERILSSVYFSENLERGPVVNEKAVQNYYEKNKDELYRTDATAMARQIVVETEETASKVKEMIESGELTFEKAIEIYSIDQSKEDQGKIGPLKENGFVRGVGRSRPFIDMIFKLKADKISDPYKTRIGWHLVQLLEKKNSGYQPIEDVKSSITEALMISDAEIKNEYNKNQQSYAARAHMKISHILLNNQEDAEKVYQQLQSGKSFDHLVKEFSVDEQSVDKKGNLGYLYKGGYIRGVGKDADFESAVFALGQGDVSRPIKTRKGWHIVRVDEKQQESIKPLVEVQEQIRQKLIRDKKDQFLESQFRDLEKKFKLKKHEDRLKVKK